MRKGEKSEEGRGRWEELCLTKCCDTLGGRVRGEGVRETETDRQNEKKQKNRRVRGGSVRKENDT